MSLKTSRSLEAWALSSPTPPGLQGPDYWVLKGSRALTMRSLKDRVYFTSIPDGLRGIRLFWAAVVSKRWCSCAALDEVLGTLPEHATRSLIQKSHISRSPGPQNSGTTKNQSPQRSTCKAVKPYAAFKLQGCTSSICTVVRRSHWSSTPSTRCPWCKTCKLPLGRALWFGFRQGEGLGMMVGLGLLVILKFRVERLKRAQGLDSWH